MKRIAFLFCFLVVATQAHALHALYGLVYSVPHVWPLEDETYDGYSLEFFSSPLGDEPLWPLISCGIAEYQYSDLYNERVEIKAVHFPIYFVIAHSYSEVFLLGLKNSYWYSIERESKSSNDNSIDYNAFQFFNGFSLRAISAPSSDGVFVLEYRVTRFDYSAKSNFNDLHCFPVVDFGYYFR